MGLVVLAAGIAGEQVAFEQDRRPAIRGGQKGAAAAFDLDHRLDRGHLGAEPLGGNLDIVRGDLLAGADELPAIGVAGRIGWGFVITHGVYSPSLAKGMPWHGIRPPL